MKLNINHSISNINNKINEDHISKIFDLKKMLMHIIVKKTDRFKVKIRPHIGTVRISMVILTTEFLRSLNSCSFSEKIKITLNLYLSTRN